MKAVEKALSDRIMSRLTAGGYVYGSPYSYPLYSSLYPYLDTLHAYHDLIVAHEYENAIAAGLHPVIEDVTKALGLVLGKDG